MKGIAIARNCRIAYADAERVIEQRPARYSMAETYNQLFAGQAFCI